MVYCGTQIDFVILHFDTISSIFTNTPTHLMKYRYADLALIRLITYPSRWPRSITDLVSFQVLIRISTYPLSPSRSWPCQRSGTATINHYISLANAWTMLHPFRLISSSIRSANLNGLKKPLVDSIHSNMTELFDE
jgi:hypothetical protein